MGTLAIKTKTSKGFPNVTTSGQQYYNIREKPSVILYTNINHHAGTPKQQSRNTVSLGVQYIEFRVPDYSNMVLEKGEIKLT